MKKLFSVFVLSFLFCFPLSAMQSLSNEKKESSKELLQKRVQELEAYLQIRKNYYSYVPSYRANCYLTIDALVWTANNHGWPFYYQIGAMDPNNPVLEVKYKDFHFDGGMRLGFGAKTNYDWEVLFQWTSFWHDISQNRTDSYGLMAAYVPVSFFKVRAKWDLDYQMIDLECARPFNAGKCFVLRPHFGIRGGWLDQKGDNHYEQPTTPPIPGEETVPARAYYKEKMWIVGPRTGFDGDLFFGKTGFSLYGNLAAALLYANVNSKLKLWVTEDNVFMQRGTMFSKSNDLKASLQLAFGFSWGKFITKGKGVGLRFRTGWEANYWWNQFQELIAWNTTNETYTYNLNQPLIIQGAAINARIDF